MPFLKSLLRSPVVAVLLLMAGLSVLQFGTESRATLYKWSQTEASNSNADSTINWAEGQAPSTVNNSARSMMAAVAKYRDDISGALTTGGISTAYTVTSNQVFGSLSNMNSAMIVFQPHVTSGSPVTLNVDGLGAKPVRFARGGNNDLPAGTLVQSTPYVVTYYNDTQEFILHNLAGNPYNIPLGGMIEFTGTTAPNGSFVLPFGQAISRTTYAAYFAMVGTTYGAGDGSTTFNVLDKRGRVSAGKDDMGGLAASRITLGGSGINGASLNGTGGAETVAIAQANLPNYTLPNTLGFSNSQTVVQGSNIFIAAAGGAAANVPKDTASGSISGTITGSVTSGGSGNALNKMPPTVIVNYILRVL